MPSEEKQTRIGELKAQVKELSLLVEVLMDRPADDAAATNPDESKNPNQLELAAGHHPLGLVDGRSEGMQPVCGVHKGERLGVGRGGEV